MTKEYPLATGELDRARLEILDRLYSPVTKTFLIKNGLQAGMTVLDYGCGMGDMTCWFAQQVGPTGKVIALDISQDSLDIAKQKAEQKGLSNIEFVCMDIKNIESLGITFDFIYGKWVLAFLSNYAEILNKLYAVLKAGGLLAYETNDSATGSQFSFPEQSVVNEWFDVCHQFFSMNGKEARLGLKAHSLFTALGLHDIKLCVNQPVLMTAQEKSVFRLAAQANKKTWLTLMPIERYDDIVERLKLMEQNEAIVGFFRNIIAIGKK